MSKDKKEDNTDSKPDKKASIKTTLLLFVASSDITSEISKVLLLQAEQTSIFRLGRLHLNCGVTYTIFVPYSDVSHVKYEVVFFIVSVA